MGNIAIIIRSVGCHHNGRAGDAEQIAKRCVDELRANGHTVLSAHAEGAGSTDLLGSTGASSLRGFVAENGTLRPIAPNDPGFESWKLVDPDAPARAAYERYLAASGGKSLVSGAELPGWDALSAEIRAAWMAAVDHTKPRLQR